MAEALGLDYVCVRDMPDEAVPHDPWTLLTAIGMATSRISLFTIVCDLAQRPPEVVAKAAASLDLLTRGRVEIGLHINAVAHAPAAGTRQAFGDDDRYSALEEAIRVMHLLWSSDESTPFNGKFFSLNESHPGCVPAHRIGIWLGGDSRQSGMLAGVLADGWLPDGFPALQPGDLARGSRHVDEGATSAGRDASEIQRVWTIAGTIGKDESAALFRGNARQWAEALAELAVDAGIDTFLLVGGEDPEDQLQAFALEVVPQIRGLVGEGEVPIPYGLIRAQQGAEASGVTPAEEETDDVDWVDQTSMESFPASDPPGSTSFT
jgi:alkanesulfonate monooxygenase SsuD/methylene tetrahydromethanopterin reductase-like flavin-dependent oxidoreductase (luciferase family)